MRAALIELCCLWSAIALQAQVLPDLRPPAQTYIYNFDGTSAVAPVAPALNLGATFSLEFWIMLERDSVDQEYMRVFQKEAGLQLDIDPGTHELSYFQVTAEPNSHRGASQPSENAVFVAQADSLLALVHIGEPSPVRQALAEKNAKALANSRAAGGRSTLRPYRSAENRHDGRPHYRGPFPLRMSLRA